MSASELCNYEESTKDYLADNNNRKSCNTYYCYTKLILDDWFMRFCIKMCWLVYNVNEEKVKCIMDKINQQEYNTEKIYKIPHIHHRCWLTIETEIPDYLIIAFTESIKMLPKSFVHYLWVLDKIKIPETIKKLPKNVIVREIKEIRKDMQALHIFDAILKDNRFTNANDILRYNLLYLFGGIYSDMGMMYLTNITDIIDCNEYMFWINKNSGKLDTGLCAAEKGNLIFKNHLYMLENLYTFNEGIQNITTSYFEQIVWSGAIFVMATINSTCTGYEKIFTICDCDIVKNNNANSWKYEGKFGNLPTKMTQLNIFKVYPN